MLVPAAAPVQGAPCHVARPGLPPRAGLGLKPEHVTRIVDTWPDVGFFEIHAENYMVEGGPLHYYLARIRERYPLSLHGVGLSIGGEEALDRAHLDRLASLIARYAPQAFSEHLAWSGHGGRFLNDLLPLAYDRPALQRVCAHIDQVQTHLKRQMLLENPASYVEFSASTMTETDFIREVVHRTGCALLLDVSNVYISSINHGRDPYDTIRALPLAAAGEIHLAGYACDRDGNGDALLIDSHGASVAAPVWDLYRYVLSLTGPLPTLLERDNEIPAFEVLWAESRQAECLLGNVTPAQGAWQR